MLSISLSAVLQSPDIHTPFVYNCLSLRCAMSYGPSTQHNALVALLHLFMPILFYFLSVILKCEIGKYTTELGQISPNTSKTLNSDAKIIPVSYKDNKENYFKVSSVPVCIYLVYMR